MTHPSPSGLGRPIDAHDVLDEADMIMTGQLPRLGQVIRDAEHLGAQMLAVLGRQYDPASAPDGTVGPGVPVADHNLTVAVCAVHTALAALGHLAALPPPVGSAIKTPARQDPEPPVPGGSSFRIATTDGPDQTTRLAAGGEPTPGSVAAAPMPAYKSAPGDRHPPAAGDSSGPSPRCDDDTPTGGVVRRGAGPGYLPGTAEINEALARRSE